MPETPNAASKSTTAVKASPAKPVTKPKVKAAEKPANVVTEPFAMPNMEVPEIMRDFAEKTINQTRDAYANMRNAAEEATDVLEDTIENARRNLLDFNLKGIELAKTNSDAFFELSKKLMSAKSLSEVVELNSTFSRERYEALSEQTKNMQGFVTDMTSEAMQPMKDAFEKSMKFFKAA